MVVVSMVHGPCGILYSESPCMIETKCTTRFPRTLLASIITVSDGYPLYRRHSAQDNGRAISLKVRNVDVVVSNSWIVPYSPFLLKIFKAHCNVVSCTRRFRDTSHERPVDAWNAPTFACVGCGPTSFEYRRTEDGFVCSTYRDACQRLRLIEKDVHWYHTLAYTVATFRPFKSDRCLSSFQFASLRTQPIYGTNTNET